MNYKKEKFVFSFLLKMPLHLGQWLPATAPRVKKYPQASLSAPLITSNLWVKFEYSSKCDSF